MSKIEEQILYTLNRIADRVEKIALDNVPKPKVEVKPAVKKSIREQMFENACSAYCSTCNTRDCEEFDTVDYECNWLDKFRRALKQAMEDKKWI